MYPVQMPSCMYLIFATKQRIIFFDPPCGLRLGDFFYPDRFKFCKSLSPLFPGLRETGFAELAYTNLIQLFCAFLNVVSIFPHKISFAVRKLLQLSNISLFWPISLPGGGRHTENTESVKAYLSTLITQLGPVRTTPAGVVE